MLLNVIKSRQGLSEDSDPLGLQYTDTNDYTPKATYKN